MNIKTKTLAILICAILFLSMRVGNALGILPDSQTSQSISPDRMAETIAQKVLAKLGGEEKWENTRFVTWNFFGRRTHVWDKWTGRLRFQDDERLVLMNVNSKTGEAWKKGEQIKQPDSLQKVLEQCYKVWINDSYWLFMPYKLTDPGVNLTYKGEGKTREGEPAYIIQLTFDEVGVTPRNKYDVWVNKKTMLVEQWAYYPNASDENPRLVTPWSDWEKHGQILLSSGRGDNRKIENIRVFQKLPDKVFESPKPLDIMDISPD